MASYLIRFNVKFINLLILIFYNFWIYIYTKDRLNALDSVYNINGTLKMNRREMGHLRWIGGSNYFVDSCWVGNDFIFLLLRFNWASNWLAQLNLLVSLWAFVEAKDVQDFHLCYFAVPCCSADEWFWVYCITKVVCNLLNVKFCKMSVIDVFYCCGTFLFAYKFSCSVVLFLLLFCFFLFKVLKL